MQTDEKLVKEFHLDYWIYVFNIYPEKTSQEK